MIVTKIDLVKHGTYNDSKGWFNARFRKHGDIVKDGRLVNLYCTESLKVQVASFLDKYAKMTNLKRHNSDVKCKSVLNAIKKLEHELKC